MSKSSYNRRLRKLRKKLKPKETRMNFEIKIIVENGRVSITHPDNLQPVALLGFLEFAKSIAIDQVKSPRPNIVPADANTLNRIAKGN